MNVYALTLTTYWRGESSNVIGIFSTEDAGKIFACLHADKRHEIDRWRIPAKIENWNGRELRYYEDDVTYSYKLKEYSVDPKE